MQRGRICERYAELLQQIRLPFPSITSGRAQVLTGTAGNTAVPSRY
jgi:hypothetical protein